MPDGARRGVLRQHRPAAQYPCAFQAAGLRESIDRRQRRADDFEDARDLARLDDQRRRQRDDVAGRK